MEKKGRQRYKCYGCKGNWLLYNLHIAISDLTPSPSPKERGVRQWLINRLSLFATTPSPFEEAGLLSSHKIVRLLRVVSAIPTATTLAMTALQHRTRHQRATRPRHCEQPAYVIASVAKQSQFHRT
jgi:hypothetical protein